MDEELHTAPKNGQIGPLFGVVVVVALLVTGGIYTVIRYTQRTPASIPYITSDHASSTSER